MAVLESGNRAAGVHLVQGDGIGPSYENALIGSQIPGRPALTQIRDIQLSPRSEVEEPVVEVVSGFDEREEIGYPTHRSCVFRNGIRGEQSAGRHLPETDAILP